VTIVAPPKRVSILIKKYFIQAGINDHVRSAALVPGPWRTMSSRAHAALHASCSSFHAQKSPTLNNVEFPRITIIAGGRRHCRNSLSCGQSRVHYRTETVQQRKTHSVLQTYSPDDSSAIHLHGRPSVKKKAACYHFLCGRKNDSPPMISVSTKSKILTVIFLHPVLRTE